MGNNKSTIYIVDINRNIIGITYDLQQAEKIFETNKHHKNCELYEAIIDSNTGLILEKACIAHTYLYM